MVESRGKAHRRWHEPNKIASNLSGIMAKILKQNHEMRSTKFKLTNQTDQCVTEQYGVGYHLYVLKV